MYCRERASRRYVVAPASSLVPIPGNMSYAEAATVPMNGLTALAALDLLDLKPGSRLLVTGGGRRVGGYAISLARHQGHFVIADGREGDRELLLQLGAGMVVPRGEAMAAAVREAAPGGVDGLVDAARLGEKAMTLVRDGGTLLTRAPRNPRAMTGGFGGRLYSCRIIFIAQTRSRRRWIWPALACSSRESQSAPHGAGGRGTPAT